MDAGTSAQRSTADSDLESGLRSVLEARGNIDVLTCESLVFSGTIKPNSMQSEEALVAGSWRH